MLTQYPNLKSYNSCLFTLVGFLPHLILLFIFQQLQSLQPSSKLIKCLPSSITVPNKPLSKFLYRVHDADLLSVLVVVKYCLHFLVRNCLLTMIMHHVSTEGTHYARGWRILVTMARASCHSLGGRKPGPSGLGHSCFAGIMNFMFV